jgi:hypothetical protein
MNGIYTSTTRVLHGVILREYYTAKGNAGVRRRARGGRRKASQRDTRSRAPHVRVCVSVSHKTRMQCMGA